MNLGHSHKTRFWYHLEVFSKISDEQPRHFYRGVPPPPTPLGEKNLKTQQLILVYAEVKLKLLDLISTK